MEQIKNTDVVLGLSSMDYVSFVLMLILCTAVGIYYGFFTGKISVTEYLVGSRNMTILPVSLSMIASVFSSSLYVGKIAETYFYGIGSLFSVIFAMSSGLVFMYIYLPALHELHLTTIYEYLHLRFGTSMRLQTSVMFIIQQVIMCPVIIYVAAMCFNEVTGINLYLMAFVTSLVCILYTCVGGLKAVIWTDVIQTLAMIVAVLWVGIIGTINVGGFHTVWERNFDSDRLDLPSIYMDFTSRYSLWVVIFAFPANSLMMGPLSQGVMQRCLCLPTLKDAQWAIIINYIGITFMLTMVSFSGCVIYATYYECDPFASKTVQRKDQIVPYYIINTLNTVVGIKGMFIAGIFSAALSTLSTSLNGLACVLLQDFYKPFFRKTATDKECKIFMMISVVTAGLIFTALVFLVEKMGSVFQITLSLSGIVNGPLLAMFTVGLYIPSVRNKAASAGYWMGFLILLWLFIGSILIAPDANAGMKPLYTFSCDKNNMSSSPLPNSLTKTNLSSFSMYKIAFTWYTLMGFAISLLIIWILNFFMQKNDVSTMDPKVLSPLIRRFLPLKKEEDLDGEIKLL